jgi:molybdopterin molybdotransferase
MDFPPWDNSAMDGYAFRHADLAPSGGRLPVSQRIAAGQEGAPLQAGTAARIFTGAPIPDGCDSVAIQEACDRDGSEVTIPLQSKPGAHIRRAAEDISAGAELIKAGTKLGAQHLGMAASFGLTHLTVRRRLRVAILASGDELVAPGRPLAKGQIYNSNRFMLSAFLRGLGCEVVDLGDVSDRLGETVRALLQAARNADLVISSGGVSVGEEDHIKNAVANIGSLELWRIAVRPGKPLAFGHVRQTPFLGTPGNPVSMFVTLCLFARPLIMRLQGVGGELRPLGFKAPAGFDWVKPDSRTEYQRARLAFDEYDDPQILSYPSRSSAALSSVTWANGLVEIPPNHKIHCGDLIDFIPFSSLLH